MAVAERNYLVLISNMPCVHLKGHESLHFILGSLRFQHMGQIEECSEEKFLEVCESKGWKCFIKDETIFVHGKKHKVFIEPGGMVFIDGLPYSIQDQIDEQRIKDERIPVKKRMKIHEEFKMKKHFKKE